jgi:hypothetical protein
MHGATIKVTTGWCCPNSSSVCKTRFDENSGVPQVRFFNEADNCQDHMARVIDEKISTRHWWGGGNRLRIGAKGPVAGLCEHGNEPPSSIQYVTQEALAADQSSFPYEPS